MARKIIMVVWGDAHATLDERSLDEIKANHQPSRIHTMGYVVHETADGISIASEWLPAENGGDETFRSITFIPKPWIIQKAVAKKREQRSRVLDRAAGGVAGAPGVAAVADEPRLSRPVLQAEERPSEVAK